KKFLEAFAQHFRDAEASLGRAPQWLEASQRFNRLIEREGLASTLPLARSFLAMFLAAEQINLPFVYVNTIAGCFPAIEEFTEVVSMVVAEMDGEKDRPGTCFRHFWEARCYACQVYCALYQEEPFP